MHNGSIPLNAPHQPTSAVLLSSSAVSFVQIGGDAHSISEWRTSRRRNGDGALEQEVADSDYGPSGRNPGDKLIREFFGGDEEEESSSSPSVTSSPTSGQLSLRDNIQALSACCFPKRRNRKERSYGCGV